ncbi:uncharacterized protein LOC110849248 [Folsomia candida]|uniref:Polyprotein n=1 Tax=Folsomia candida TaxID=158441 RepID=A0A226EHP1_FOLCA|nr:uncharacterized protein LOC110849248 [Folsomia candida]OXA56617.1 polyprotein [Folsomia candida]
MESAHISGMPKVASAIKQSVINKEKLINSRMARLLWKTQELDPQILSPAAIRSTTQNHNLDKLENPLVVAAISAGVIGVVIIAVMILSMWIRSKFLTRPGSRTNSNDIETDVIMTSSPSRSISISMSTLDGGEGQDNEGSEDKTQMESIRLDDTTFYSAVDISIIPVDISVPCNPDDKDLPENHGMLDERTLCNISLSPIYK